MFPFDFVIIPMLACEPTTIAALSLALAGAGTVTTLISQSQQASAQGKFQQRLAQSRNEEFQRQAQAAQLEEAQQKEANARRLFSATQASQKAEATARVAAGDAGVSGTSVDALLREFRTQSGMFEEATIRQDELVSQGTATKIELGQFATRSGNTSINAPIAQPNFAGEFLRLGERGLGIYSQYKANTSPSNGRRG